MREPDFLHEQSGQDVWCDLSFFVFILLNNIFRTTEKYCKHFAIDCFAGDVPGAGPGGKTGKQGADGQSDRGSSVADSPLGFPEIEGWAALRLVPGEL